MEEIKVISLNTITKVPLSVYFILGLSFLMGMWWIYLKRKRANENHIIASLWRDAARLLLVEWIALISCSAVVFREEKSCCEMNLIPFWSYFDYVENSYLWEMTVLNLLNICMFVPVGALLKLGFQEFAWKKVLLVGCVLSFIIELSQFIFRKGLCEVDDLIHNVAGCMVGYAIATLILTESNDKNKKKIKR